MPTPDQNVRVWFDGALTGSDRVAFGYVVAEGDRVIFTGAGCAGDNLPVTSQSAELAALIAAFKYLQAHCIAGAKVSGDCRPVIDAVKGTGIAVGVDPQQIAQAQQLYAELPGTCLKWLPRHHNANADRVAAQAVKNYQGLSAAPNPAHQVTDQRREAKRKRSASSLRRKVRQILARLIDLL